VSDPFRKCADDYFESRPGYPQELYALVRMKSRLGDGAHVLDVGCGTGIVTTELAARWWKVVGVDPSASMLTHAARELDEHAERAPLARARAENLPFRDESFDLLTCAQAFHWMQPQAALAEFARVLKPGTLAAVFFNERRFEEEGFTRDFEDLIVKHNPAFDPRFLQKPWDRMIADSGRFRLIQYFRFDWEWTRSPAELAGYVASISYLRNTLGSEAWPALLHELDELAARHAGSEGDVALKMRTDLWVARRK
jgi:SAM-dependent methyltransferase